ncbi:MAG: IS5 family transposase [Gammaproteobacteria bacterium]
MREQQATFAQSGFEQYRKRTRREQFLEEMEQVVPWKQLCAVIQPHYPKVEGAGRPPVGVERMLRIYFLQQWFNLSDPGVEEALYDSSSMRTFVGIDLGREPAPDETTVCKFRHLLEQHNLGKQLFQAVNGHLQTRGLKVASGTIVDATIIGAPSSTKNQARKRDPEMCQTKKGNQYYFGMKAHIGVDSKTKLIHSVFATPANTHDSQVLPYLLHGKETRVWGDSAYSGQTDVIRNIAPCAQDFTHHKGCRNRPLTTIDGARNRTKSQVRAKVEHLFRVIKCSFGFIKVRYRGLKKNAHRLFVACALANLYMVRRRLLRMQPA